MRDNAKPTFVSSCVSMSAKSTKRKPRKVFLTAAIGRLLHQPWRNRPRTAVAITSFILSEAAWWLTSGVWHVPGTLLNTNRSTLLRISPTRSDPAFHVYAATTYQHYVDTCITLPQDKKQPQLPRNPLVIVYVHGGAWGSGDAAHYSQLAAKIADSAEAIVLVLSYRLYPVATISEQVNDVVVALRHARETFDCEKLVILAHSSGANISALALLKSAAKQEGAQLADIAIFTAGPYHLMHHFLFESRRGVAAISPMLPAAEAESDHTRFDECSPSVIAERLTVQLAGPQFLTSPTALEGDLPASNIPLPDADVEGTVANFPQTYIISSSCDKVVPLYSSIRFSTALRRKGLAARLLVYDGIEHVDFVTDWFAAAKSRELNDLLDVDSMDQKRRLACVDSLAGTAHSKLSRSDERARGVSPYVRDVLRILEGLKNQ